jgi:NAD(P)-dependent dehydrogenase (short-subunit alcohol dehydrogenase family)
MAESVALITGALTGIGRATAVIFAQQGAHVVVSGRREKEGQDLAAELKALGAQAEFIRAACGGVRLCSQQTCGGGVDKVCRTGSRWDRCPRQRGGPRHDGYGHAHALHQYR